MPSKVISPSGCLGKSNNPHKSTSEKTYGFVKGYSSTTCTRVVPQVKIRTTVWRSRWFGYEQMGEPGVDSAHGTGVGRSGIWRACDSTIWRTVGQHTALDVDGRTYTAETMKYEPITC